MLQRREASPISASATRLIRGKKVEVHEEIVLRNPFGQLKQFVREGVGEKDPPLADRRSDVGPLRDSASRHGRADASEA